MLSSTDDDSTDDAASSGDVLTRLRGAPAAGPADVLVPFLQGEVQAVLRLPSTPSPTVGFFDLGMDSLMAVELRNRLNRAFSGEYVVSNTAIFDYPDINSLAGHLGEELADVGGTAEEPAAPEPMAPEPTETPKTDEDGIAVVGMACRFPGAGDLAAFWDLLESGTDAITDGRQDGGSWSGAVGDPDAEDMVSRRGAFVDGIDWFDSRFFRISPIEATMMDPRQRMLLETTWQAIEDAGFDPNQLRGSRTGVYAGVGGSEYRDLIEAGNKDQSYLGTTASVTVGRIAFALGLEGPAMPVDMACASSLAAVHQAAVGLRRGEVDLAIAGGVNVVLSLAVSAFMMDIGMLSPTGQCIPFDASADGYVRGEGCGIVVLKRLSEAKADGDRIWAVIRGSAVNQNGASAGLTVPNGPAQERVMAQALAEAGVAPAEVDYLEAHAVGSQLGDPIELNAVASVYGRDRDPDRPLQIGSVKSNIGHVEWAAGIAAFIKTVLSMNHGAIPGIAHLETLNPNVDWDQAPFRVTPGKVDWPDVSGREPLAGVSAFGLSGTNAHVLVEGYGSGSSEPATDNGTHLAAGTAMPVGTSSAEPDNGLPTFGDDSPERTSRLLPLSGKSEGALRDAARSYLSWLEGNNGSDAHEALYDMVWTASTGRSHFEHRAGLVFSDAAQLRKELQTLAETDGSHDQRLTGAAAKVAFAYFGQPSLCLGNVETLYRSEPVARAVLDRCDELVREARGTSLLDVMFGRDRVEADASDLGWAWPSAYALDCALTALWASIGIRPTAVFGHGPGALAAAQASGAVSLDDGLRLAIVLGDLAYERQARGDENAPEPLEAVLAGVDFAAPNVSLVNSATGRLVESAGALDVDYWLTQVQEPNDLSGCANALAQLGVGAVVEFGPPSVSVQLIRDAWPQSSESPVVLPTFEASSGDGEFARAAARAYESGLDITFEGLFTGEARRRISIPTYPFQRRRHWI